MEIAFRGVGKTGLGHTRRWRVGVLAALSLGLMLFAPSALAGVIGGPITIDFDTLPAGLANGERLPNGTSLGGYADLSTGEVAAGGNLGAMIFDTTPGVSASHPWLGVDSGNALGVQHTSSPATNPDGTFVDPDNASVGGIFTFDFVSAVELLSLSLIDHDNTGVSAGDWDVVLTDVDGLQRSYLVPLNFTGSLGSGGAGIDILDLTILSAQMGAGGSTATASEDQGFDPLQVVQLEVVMRGSGLLDNIVFQNREGTQTPEPATWLTLGAGLLGLGLRRWRARERGSVVSQ